MSLFLATYFLCILWPIIIFAWLFTPLVFNNHSAVCQLVVYHYRLVGMMASSNDSGSQNCLTSSPWISRLSGGSTSCSSLTSLPLTMTTSRSIFWPFSTEQRISSEHWLTPPQITTRVLSSLSPDLTARYATASFLSVGFNCCSQEDGESEDGHKNDRYLLHAIIALNNTRPSQSKHFFYVRFKLVSQNCTSCMLQPAQRPPLQPA